MDDQRLELAHAWLQKSLNDLENARIVSEVTDGPLDTAIYHCQQAAEKAIKGFLISREIAFGKTHDLAKLVLQATAVDLAFSQLQADAEELTPFAVLYRYPGEQGFTAPTKEEFESALKAANRFVSFIQQLLFGSR